MSMEMKIKSYVIFSVIPYQCVVCFKRVNQMQDEFLFPFSHSLLKLQSYGSTTPINMNSEMLFIVLYFNPTFIGLDFCSLSFTHSASSGKGYW